MKNLIDWSRDLYHHLPWRKQRTLYSTLVSEIMLQQTTVGTVLNHYERFLKIYPTIWDIARASEEELAVNWKGLGYYRRARNLRLASIEICERFQGEIPLDRDVLLTIPGIGPYTASAIIAIGADKIDLAVDANLERVLARLYGIKTQKGPKLMLEIHNKFKKGLIAQEIYQVGARVYNEALMDLGRSICQARKADCLLCPLSNDCSAYKENKVLEYPKQDLVIKNQMFELKLLRFLVEKDGKYLAYKKGRNQWLSDQWEVPTFILDSEDIALKQYPEINLGDFDTDLLPSFKSSITKYKIENKVLLLSEEEFGQLVEDQKYSYLPLNRQQNFSTASFKAYELLK